MPYLSSESVSPGHPDKVADQLSDAIVDAYLSLDPYAKVACETVVSKGAIIIAGEITSSATVDREEVIRNTLSHIYPEPHVGFDWHSCGIIQCIHGQSPELSIASQKGASDQCIVYGYATDATSEFLPLPFVLANEVLRVHQALRESKKLPFLLQDAKSLVTVFYDDSSTPQYVSNVILSTQHDDTISLEELRAALLPLIKKVIPKQLLSDQTQILINPAGKFLSGGPATDTGVTGRKQAVDTYGTVVRHGGGAFSGKDPSKIDRSGAYLARYIAKNIVHASLAKHCEIMLTYAIGIDEPVAINCNTYDTGSYDTKTLVACIKKVFCLSSHKILQDLDLLRPIYQKTSCYGHFGRMEADFTWEKTDKKEALLQNLA